MTPPSSFAPPAPAPAPEDVAAADATRPAAAPGLGAADPPFAQALAAVQAELYARDDVDALLFFGSVQRGTARPASDLDMLVVTGGMERWAQCRWVHGVEVQLQFGPAHIWRMRVEQGQPVVTHAFASGELRFVKRGDAADIQRLAREAHAAGPRGLTTEEVHRERFELSNLLCDLEELPPHDVEARMTSWKVVIESLRAWSVFNRVWLEKKPAALLRNVRARDAALAALVEEFSRSGLPRDAVAVGDAVLAPVGGRSAEFSTVPKPA